MLFPRRCVRSLAPRQLLLDEPPVLVALELALSMSAGTVWGVLELVNAEHIVRCSTSHLRALTTEPCRVLR